MTDKNSLLQTPSDPNARVLSYKFGIFGAERSSPQMPKNEAAVRGCIEIKKYIIQHRYLVVVGATAFDNGFV